MIEAKELRIGNHVICLGEEREIIGLTKRNKDGNEIFMHCAEFKGLVPIKVIHLKPIELTEEWLLKFGLEVNKGWDDQWFFSCPNKSMFQIEEAESGYEYDYTELKYVHQLQNLYFVLTGEELKQKKPFN